MELKDKVAIVTGGASGLGRATTEEMISRGAKVVIFDTSGAEIARATSPAYRNEMPHPGWVEQNPEEVWQAVVAAIRAAVERLPEDSHVLAICMAALA